MAAGRTSSRSSRAARARKSDCLRDRRAFCDCGTPRTLALRPAGREGAARGRDPAPDGAARPAEPNQQSCNPLLDTLGALIPRDQGQAPPPIAGGHFGGRERGPPHGTATSRASGIGSNSRSSPRRPGRLGPRSLPSLPSSSTSPRRGRRRTLVARRRGYASAPSTRRARWRKPLSVGGRRRRIGPSAG